MLRITVRRVPWFNPSQQLSPTQPLAHSPLSGNGERIGRVKVRKLVGWDKDSLIGKAKATHTSKAKPGIHSSLPTSRQVFSHLQESRAPPHVTVTWEDKRHHSERPPFLLLPAALCAEHDVIWPGISLGSVRVSCPGCVPSQLLVSPQPPRWWGGVRLCVSTAQQ